MENGLAGLLGLISGWKDPRDFSDRDNTQLTPVEEAEFRQWKRAGDVYDYDARGAWKAIRDGRMNGPDERDHLEDPFKKPNHPTFSDESIYHGFKGLGGHWDKDANGNYVGFTPGITNQYSPSELARYFFMYEPGLRLNDNRTGVDWALRDMFARHGG
jgi:hypothetical protein